MGHFFTRPVAPLALGTLLAAAAYGVALFPGDTPPWAPWSLAAGTLLAMSGLMALGARRRGRLPVTAAVAIVIAVTIAGIGFMLALVLHPESAASEPVFLGLPRRAAILIYGLGLLPSLVLPTVYAWRFDRDVLDEGDLERLAESARNARDTAASRG